MSGEPVRASLLLRFFAKALDFILIAALAEIVPKAGFYAGLAYLLMSDSLFEGRSIGKLLIGLQVSSLKTGGTCSVRDSIVRNALLGAGLLCYRVPLVGPWVGWIVLPLITVAEFLILLGSREGMRLGDEFARTTVREKAKNELQQEA